MFLLCSHPGANPRTLQRPTISGLPFLTLFHHDGRFIRAPGLFAFAARRCDGRYEILHFELAEVVNRCAGPGHPRWTWALRQGMDALLVHMLGARQLLPDAAEMQEARWHPEAEVVFDAALERGEPLRPERWAAPSEHRRPAWAATGAR